MKPLFPKAYYQADMSIGFLGHRPPKFNRAAPEVSGVIEAATAAARRVIEDAGFQIASTGRGSYRLPDVSVDES